MAVSVLWLFLTVPWVGHQCVIVLFTDHTHFFGRINLSIGLYSYLVCMYFCSSEMTFVKKKKKKKKIHVYSCTEMAVDLFQLHNL